MFCNACGKPVPAGAMACPACGQAQPVTVFATPAGSRVSHHAKILGILWIAYSALHILGGVFVMVLANTVFVHLAQREDVPHFLQPLMGTVALFILIKGAIGLAAGFGVLQRAPWARTAALVVAFISLFNQPFGTALGIYTLWVMLGQSGDRDYERYVAGEAVAR